MGQQQVDQAVHVLGQGGDISQLLNIGHVANFHLVPFSCAPAIFISQFEKVPQLTIGEGLLDTILKTFGQRLCISDRIPSKVNEAKSGNPLSRRTDFVSLRATSVSSLSILLGSFSIISSSVWTTTYILGIF